MGLISIDWQIFVKYLHADENNIYKDIQKIIDVEDYAMAAWARLA